jgi:hypothetical protein
MAAIVKNKLNNENGMALVIVMLMLAIVTILGIGATQTSTNEVQLASNERQLVDVFYKSEARLLDTLEHSAAWLTDAFLLSGSTPYTNSDINKRSSAIAEIRWINNSGTPIAGLSAAANDLPIGSHTSPPPAGSGYSMGKFAAHRYGVTISVSTPPSGNTAEPSSAYCLNFPDLCSQTRGNSQLQAGVWKVFNK